MLARHASDLTGPFSGAFYKLYMQTLVCGNTRTTRHVQPLRSCRKNWSCKLPAGVLTLCRWIFPCPCGFFNPMRIPRMKINDMIWKHEAWHVKFCFAEQEKSWQWCCRDRVSSCNIYAVQQDIQSVLISEFIQHFLQVCNGWTCRVVRVLPHTKVCEYNLCKTLLKMEWWGPKHVELT